MTTQQGCKCLEACARDLVLSPFYPECTTFKGLTLPVNGTATCGPGLFGQRSELNGLYWDYCTPLPSNLTQLDSSGVFNSNLTTFRGMFMYMFLASLVGVVVAYALVSVLLLVQLRSSASRAIVFLPVIGLCHATPSGAIFAALVSLMYLSIPYAIDGSTAIVLGLTMAAVVVWYAANRDSSKQEPFHAVEYAEM
jgi:hypothetical protein